VSTSPKIIHDILDRYARKGVFVAGEIVLPPNIALELLSDLEGAEVYILGVDVWYALGQNFVEEILSLDNSKISDDFSAASIDRSRSFIQQNMVEDKYYFSLVIDDQDWQNVETNSQ
jgi:hypothetical protein